MLSSNLNCASSCKIGDPMENNRGNESKTHMTSINSPFRQIYRQNWHIHICLGHPVKVKMAETDSIIHS